MSNLLNPRFIWLVLLFVIVGCTSDPDLDPDTTDGNGSTGAITNDYIVKGRARIKLANEPQGQLRILQTRSGITTGVKALDPVAVKLGATSMKRVFPEGGKFEERKRAEGLHLWYDIYYDESYPITKAAVELQALEDIETAEPVRKIKPTERAAVVPFETSALKNNYSTKAAGMPFNDPELPFQWHYNNDGSLTNAVEGADIRLFNAWQATTGHPDVIVAVLDEGVQYDHPDLQANMWINEAEMNGVEGVDDDGNGYIDDIYGYNFVSDNGSIEPSNHGTHVAGTIAAVNNNGEGVCGIAGGDHANNIPGVRIMSCKIITSDGERWSFDDLLPQAYVYSADNGAVISQNSWSYDFPPNTTPHLPLVVKDAIDYFIKYAGVDADGNQTGAMRGGIVFFAAGNDNSSEQEYPPAYEEVVTVAAIAPDYTKASYTNYGSWIDISAPGGERYSNDDNTTMVLSTIAGGLYGYLPGSSMACPHVSGVAALYISQFGVNEKGLIPEILKETLMNTTYDLDPYNTSYNGLLGNGGVNADVAINGIGHNVPKLIRRFDNIYFGSIGESYTIDLADHFHDANYEKLDYTVQLSDDNIVTATVNDERFVLSAKNYGRVKVNVVANGPGKMKARGSFVIMCRDNNSAVDLYPNPVTRGSLYIRTGKEHSGRASVTIHNSAGAVALRNSVTLDPFNAAMLDISGLAGGYYSLAININGQTVKGSFIKY